MGHPPDLDRRLAARQCVPGYAAGHYCQGNHGTRRTGSRFPGERDGCGSAASSRIPSAATFWTGSRAHCPRPAGWTGVLPPSSLPCRWLLSASAWTIISYCAGLRGAGIVLSARPSITCISNPPKVDEICDIEGAALVQRADDTEQVFAERMRSYEALTTPVIEHYRALGRFAEVDGDRPIGEVAAGIVFAVERLRAS